MNKVVDAVKKVLAPKKVAAPKVEVEEVSKEVRDAEFLKRHTGARDGVIYE